MNYNEIVNYIGDTSKGLGYDVTFFHGRTPNAQLVKDIKTIYVMLLPLMSSGSVASSVNESYTVNIMVFMQDRADSGTNLNASDVLQKEMEILTQTNYIVDQLVRKLSDNDISNALHRSSDLLVISSFSKDNAIKVTSQLLTGTTLTMNIIIPDQFNYCC